MKTTEEKKYGKAIARYSILQDKVEREEEKLCKLIAPIIKRLEEK